MHNMGSNYECVVVCYIPANLKVFFDAAKETVVKIKPGRSHRLIHRENFQLLGGGISLFLVRSMEILHMLRSAQVFFRFKESLVFAPNTKDRPAFYTS